MPKGNGYHGQYLFAAPAGSELRQHVSFEDLAADIDAGKGTYAVGAQLGGAAPADVTMRLIAQPVDAQGTPLGAPLVLGPPTAADLESRSETITCSGNGTFEPGARFLDLTLQPQGGANTHLALADDITTADMLLNIGVGGERPGEGPGCIIEPGGGVTPTPTPTATVSASPTAIPTASPTPSATPTKKPAASHVRLRRRSLSLRVPSAAELRITITRVPRRAPHDRRTLHANLSSAGTIAIGFRRLRPGRYRVRISSADDRLTRVSVARRIRG